MINVVSFFIPIISTIIYRVLVLLFRLVKYTSPFEIDNSPDPRDSYMWVSSMVNFLEYLLKRIFFWRDIKSSFRAIAKSVLVAKIMSFLVLCLLLFYIWFIGFTQKMPNKKLYNAISGTLFHRMFDTIMYPLLSILFWVFTVRAVFIALVETLSYIKFLITKFKAKLVVNAVVDPSNPIGFLLNTEHISYKFVQAYKKTLGNEEAEVFKKKIGERLYKYIQENTPPTKNGFYVAMQALRLMVNSKDIVEYIAYVVIMLTLLKLAFNTDILTKIGVGIQDVGKSLSPMQLTGIGIFFLYSLLVLGIVFAETKLKLNVFNEENIAKANTEEAKDVLFCFRYLINPDTKADSSLVLLPTPFKDIIGDYTGYVGIPSALAFIITVAICYTYLAVYWQRQDSRQTDKLENIYDAAQVMHGTSATFSVIISIVFLIILGVTPMSYKKKLVILLILCAVLLLIVVLTFLITFIIRLKKKMDQVDDNEEDIGN